MCYVGTMVGCRDRDWFVDQPDCIFLAMPLQKARFAHPLSPGFLPSGGNYVGNLDMINLHRTGSGRGGAAAGRGLCEHLSVFGASPSTEPT